MKKIFSTILLTLIVFLTLGNIKAVSTHTVRLKHLNENGITELATLTVDNGNTLTTDAPDQSLLIGGEFNIWLVNGEFLGHNVPQSTFTITKDTELMSISIKSENALNIYTDVDSSLLDYLYYPKLSSPEHIIPEENLFAENEAFDSWNYYKTVKTKIKFYVLVRKAITKIYTFEDLPESNDKLETSITKKAFNEYDINIFVEDSTYQITVDSIPEWLENSNKIYYYTDSLGNRLLVGFYSNVGPFNDKGNYAEEIVDNSWIVFNLTEGEYKVSEFNVIHAKTFSVGNGWTSHNHLYADISIPHNLDKLLSINITYSYKYKYVIGESEKPIVESEKILLANKKMETEKPWYRIFTDSYSYFFNKKATRLIYRDKEITDITHLATSDYKNDYLEWLRDHGSGNYTLHQVFPAQNKVYRLFLGQKNKFWSTGVWIEDFAVLSYRYEVDGIAFSNPYPQTETGPMDPPENVISLPSIDKFWNDIWGGFLKFMWFVVPVVALLTVQIPMKIASNFMGSSKAKRNRMIIAISWVAAICLIWYFIISK